MTSLPYPIYGTITATDASTPSTKVVLRNDRTGETTNATSNTSGEYLVDAGNFTSGYMTSDRVTIVIGYGDEEGEGSILLSSDTHTIDVTLTAIADSTDTTYCTIQDVLDELGDKTTDDISYERVRKIILRSEAEIDETVETKFALTTVTDEIHDYNQYTSWTSPEGLNFPRRPGFGSNNRGDSIGAASSNDSIRVLKYPIVSVTALSKNTAADYQTDNWSELDEQTGSGGDFVKDLDTGIIQFVSKSPNYGRRQLKVTYVYGYSTVPKTVEKLCILLSVRDVLNSKRNSDAGKSMSALSVDGWSSSGGSGISMTYQRFLNDEIKRLWDVVGSLVTRRA